LQWLAQLWLRGWGGKAGGPGLANGPRSGDSGFVWRQDRWKGMRELVLGSGWLPGRMKPRTGLD
jgi:hypothetical protein